MTPSVCLFTYCLITLRSCEDFVPVDVKTINYKEFRLYGDVIQGVGGNKELFTLVEPLGVAAMICPWNFPIGMPARKVGRFLGLVNRICSFY